MCVQCPLCVLTHRNQASVLITTINCIPAHQNCALFEQREVCMINMSELHIKHRSERDLSSCEFLLVTALKATSQLQ